MWRATAQTWIHTGLLPRHHLLGVVDAVLCWAGRLRLLRHGASDGEFRAGEATGVAALTCGCCSGSWHSSRSGGEWFLMWQSNTWNGQEAAFRMFTSLGIILIYLTMSQSRKKGFLYLTS